MENIVFPFLVFPRIITCELVSSAHFITARAIDLKLCTPRPCNLTDQLSVRSDSCLGHQCDFRSLNHLQIFIIKTTGFFVRLCHICTLQHSRLS
jgi:hypothetical protein